MQFGILILCYPELPTSPYSAGFPSHNEAGLRRVPGPIPGPLPPGYFGYRLFGYHRFLPMLDRPREFGSAGVEQDEDRRRGAGADTEKRKVSSKGLFCFSADWSMVLPVYSRPSTALVRLYKATARSGCLTLSSFLSLSALLFPFALFFVWPCLGVRRSRVTC